MGKRLATALLSSLLLVSALLVGCAPGGDDTVGFVGTWALDGLTTGGEQAEGEELGLYKAMGVYIIMGSDHTVLFEMFGFSVTGTFEVEDAATATVSFSESEAADAGIPAKQTLARSDGKLLLKDGVDTMTFEQIDPSQKKTFDAREMLGDLDEATLEETLGTLGKDIKGAADGTFPLSDAEKVDEFVASDAVCSIRLQATGTYLGEPGYLLSIQNKTDERIVVRDGGSFSVGDRTVNPVLLAVVDAGSSAREVLWFPKDELGEDAGELEDVSGTIVVRGAESGDELGTYDFAA